MVRLEQVCVNIVRCFTLGLRSSRSQDCRTWVLKSLLWTAICMNFLYVVKWKSRKFTCNKAFIKTEIANVPTSTSSTTSVVNRHYWYLTRPYSSPISYHLVVFLIGFFPIVFYFGGYFRDLRRGKMCKNIWN